MKTSNSKKMNSKKISKVLILFFVLSAVFFQFCQKEEYLPSEQEIFNSNEFIEYVDASIVYYGSIMEKAIQLSETIKSDPTGENVIVNSSVYRLKIIPYNSLDILNKRIEMQNMQNILLKKYPNYMSYKSKKIINHIINTISTPKISKTLSLYKIFDQKSPMVRLKGTMDEGQTYWNNCYDAFGEAIYYSWANHQECGGFVFTDGTSMLYFDPNATPTGTNYMPGDPNSVITVYGGVSYYQGNEIASTFHTHPNGSTSSQLDRSSQYTWFPNCSMIILYNTNIYEYQYVNGCQQY